MLKGSCLCGGIRYEIDGELGPVALCHCGMCRKATGTAFASNASVARSAFRLIAGGDLVQRYQSSPGAWRCFCRNCGSPDFSDSEAMPELVRLRLGSFDDDPGVRPGYHFAVNFKAPWFEISDDLPQLVLEDR